jgi:hypothetical protein
MKLQSSIFGKKSLIVGNVNKIFRISDLIKEESDKKKVHFLFFFDYSANLIKNNFYKFNFR